MSLAFSFFNNTVLNFQLVPGHAGLPGNKNADLLAKTGASLLTDATPCTFPSVTAKIHYFHYHNWNVTYSTPTQTTKSPKSLRRNCSFLTLFAVSFPVFAAMNAAFFYLHIFTGSVRRRILLVVPVDTLYRTSIISSSTVLPLNSFVNLSLVPLSLFSTYGPDLGEWHDCWAPRSSSTPPSLRRGRLVPPPPPPQTAAKELRPRTRLQKIGLETGLETSALTKKILFPCKAELRKRSSKQLKIFQEIFMNKFMVKSVGLK